MSCFFSPSPDGGGDKVWEVRFLLLSSGDSGRSPGDQQTTVVSSA